MLVAHTAEYYIMYISTKVGKSQYNSPTLSTCKNRLRYLFIKLSRSPAPKNINHFGKNYIAETVFWEKIHKYATAKVS